MEKESQLRDYLIEKIEKEIPYCRLNGDRERRLPNNVNFSFQYIEGESLLIMLDMKGICAPADLRVHRDRWILHMFFWQSGFLMKLHTDLCV